MLITRQIQAKFVVYPLNMPLPPHFDSKWPKIPPNSIVAMGMHQPSFVSQESFWICAAAYYDATYIPKLSWETHCTPATAAPPILLIQVHRAMYRYIWLPARQSRLFGG